MPKTYTWISDPQLIHPPEASDAPGSAVHSGYGLTRVDPNHPGWSDGESITWHESLPTDPIA